MSELRTWSYDDGPHLTGVVPPATALRTGGQRTGVLVSGTFADIDTGVAVQVEAQGFQLSV